MFFNLKETVEAFSKLLPLKRRPAMRHALLAAAMAFKFKLAAITIAHVGMTASVGHSSTPPSTNLTAFWATKQGPFGQMEGSVPCGSIACCMLVVCVWTLRTDGR